VYIYIFPQLIYRSFNFSFICSTYSQTCSFPSYITEEMNMAKLSTLFYTLFFFLVCFSHDPSSYANAIFKVYNVINYGAKPDGITDSTSGFLNAWGAACASVNSTIITVPKGTYALASLAFKGEHCKSSGITFRIDGTLVAKADYRVLAQPNTWLSFEAVTGVSIVGGTLDAKGPPLWACKAATTNCPTGATVRTRGYYIHN
jgi:polygalacturonase